MVTSAVDFLVKTAETASNLREIRNLRRKINEEMLRFGDEESAEFDKLAKASAMLDDRLGDVRDRIDQMNPDKFSALDSAARVGATGIQVVTGAMALFGDQSEDAQKALLKVQAAMAFAQGISQVRDLKKEFQNLWTIVKANPIIAIVTALAALGTAAFAVYKHFTATSQATKELNEQYEKQKELTKQLNTEYDAQITILSAQVGKEHEVFEAKKKKIEASIAEIKVSFELHKSKLQDIQDNDNIEESILRTAAATLNKIGATEKAEAIEKVIAIRKQERAKEELDAAKNDLNTISQLRADLTALTITENNRQADAGKKSREEELKNLSAHDQHRLDLHNEYLKKRKAAEDAELERRRIQREQEQADELAWQQAQIEADEQLAAMQAAHDQRQVDNAKKTAAERKLIIESTLGETANLFGQLSEFTKKNAKVSKAFSIAQATMNTYLSATKALAAYPPPASYIAAAAAIAQGFFMVRKIAAVEPGSASTGGGVSMGAFGGAPVINQEPAGTQPTTPLDENGNVVQQNNNQPLTPQRVYVVESDITGSQRRVDVLDQMAVE